MEGLTIAIDPGVNGAMAWHFGNTDTIFVESLPKKDSGIDVYAFAEKISEILNQHEGNGRVIIEKVGGFVAGKERTGSSMFTFGMSYGLILGVLAQMGVSLVLVPPQSWQKYLGLGSRNGRSTPAWKGHLAAVAKKMYPKLNVTKKNADALLILEYARKH